MASRASFNGSSASDRSYQASAPVPLRTSKLANSHEHPSRETGSKKQKVVGDVMDTLLKKLHESEASNLQNTTTRSTTPDLSMYRDARIVDKSSSGDSIPATPSGKKSVGDLSSSPNEAFDAAPSADVLELKRLLASQQQQIALMQQELDQTRHTTGALQRTVGTSADSPHGDGEINQDTINRLQTLLNASTRPATSGLQSEFRIHDDEQAPGIETPAAAIQGRGIYTWTDADVNANRNANAALQANQPATQPVPSSVDATFDGNSHGGHEAHFNFNPPAQKYSSAMTNTQFPRSNAGTLRIDTARSIANFGNIGQPSPLTARDPTPLQSRPPSRPGSAMDSRFVGYAGYPNNLSPAVSQTGFSPPATPLPFQPFGNGMQAPPNMVTPTHPYMMRPIGTRSSPPGSEFTGSMTGPWNAQLSMELSEPIYIPPVEPLNYRRLLERDASCNWDYIVEKIICNNDQQASIFLQQKLKQASPEHKFQIVQSIIQKCYPLMVNRFGNFLVQRCFEHGTQDQIIAIANAIRGNTLALSMDAFGCHVVQKAFDVVPEEYKAMMVHELLRNIPQTVIHRYACHVWQKLFELRWSDSPPQIMKYVNEALCGMWHSVALGETGSLVVQNIFENCLEEDKRPCIDECLASIDDISRGQFGNWCIQHICEHGAAADRSWAVDHILRNAQEYSMDQYASKVVEKCLKIGGDEFMDRYLDRVCEARSDRPRQAIIDVAGDQYGNYLIQWILANASPHHREIVSAHVRKHMVSLRGSKYGSRVAMLCSNPQSATRPGAPAGFQLNRFSTAGSAAASMTNNMGTMSTGRPPFGTAFR